ncbi:MAG: hypothetical protein GX632_03570 [Propioniciclava sp.]|mgnify:FL=1|nr:hypothetical protein [Propioniciclava sp.]
MSPAPWADLPLETRLGAMPGLSFLAVDGDDYALGTVLAPSASSSLNRVVEAWVRRRGSASRRSRELPRHQTLEACCLLMGLAPRHAIVVPRLDWLREREPGVRVGEVWLDADALLARVPTPRARTDAARARVDAVKQEYGRLRGDLVYRIENAALFDPAVPLTRQFETALVLWDDVDAATPSAEVTRRAGLVQVSFETARAHAETVGVAHLPLQARADAERAAKAARLARATASEAERRTALDRVTRILRSLVLYYLPDPDAVDRALTR